MNIVITGCSSGIGSELVKILTKSHKVYGLSRNSYKLDKLKSSLNKPKNFHFYPGDVVTIDTKIINEWITDSHVDLLINNAGILINKSFVNIKYSDYKSVMDVNFWGAFNVTQLLLEKLSGAKGSVINISSMGGVNFTSKYPGLSLYSSSKAALSVLTECLSEELKDNNIRVNAFALGAVQTEMLSEAFPGYNSETSAHQMASFIVNFINSSNNLVNGQVFRVANSNP